MAVIDLLRNVTVLDEQGNRGMRHLERIINEKNRVSYQGEMYTKRILIAFGNIWFVIKYGQFQ